MPNVDLHEWTSRGGAHYRLVQRGESSYVQKNRADSYVMPGNRPYWTNASPSEERMALANEVCRLRGLLGIAREALKTLPEDALGYEQRPSGEAALPIRDELVHRLDQALREREGGER